MVHTKLDLQAWFEKLTAGEISVIVNPPKFYYNDKWSQEELNDCVNAVMQEESYNHGLTFSYIPAADKSYPHIQLELRLVSGNPCIVESVLPNQSNTDRKSFETKIQWLTHMGCHLVSQWYKDQLLATAWQSMGDTNNE